jgi:hypothetical protein
MDGVVVVIYLRGSDALPAYRDNRYLASYLSVVDLLCSKVNLWMWQ